MSILSLVVSSFSLLAQLSYPDLTSVDYQRLSAIQKVDILAKLITKDTYQQLPKAGSISVDAISPAFLTHALTREGDTMVKGRRKLFHPIGTTAMVKIQMDPVSGYTGALAKNALGVLRFSSAFGESTGQFSPGIALKILQDGAPSVNVLAIHSLETYTCDPFDTRFPLSNAIPMISNSSIKNVFLKAVVLPAFKKTVELVTGVPGTSPLRLPLSHLAHAGLQRGQTPSAPYAVAFVPSLQVVNGVAKDCQSDFRTKLSKIPAGTPIYKIVALDQNGRGVKVIGQVTTLTSFNANAFQDIGLYFKHNIFE